MQDKQPAISIPEVTTTQVPSDSSRPKSAPVTEVPSGGNSQNHISMDGGAIVERRPSGYDIVIGVEDESGQELPVEIDETEDEILHNEEEVTDGDDFEPPSVSPQRRVSITERVLKMQNVEQHMANLSESAESRKRELQELLNEHAQLVQEVTTMEVTGAPVYSPGADKENESFRPVTMSNGK